MKPIENTENFVRRGKANVATDPRMDRRVLDDSFAAMNEAVGTGRSSVACMILQGKAIRFAAAAVVIAAIGLLTIKSRPPDMEPPEIEKVAESPAEMLTARSLMIAFHHGGIEAIEKQCDKALQMQGQRPDILSEKELLTLIEFDLERTEL